MDTSFVNQCMLTCIGNKRKLVKEINKIVARDIVPKMNKPKLDIFDGFAGSSVVSRSLIHYADNLYVNDMEPYSYIMAKTFFEKPNESQKQLVIKHIKTMNELAENGPFYEGIITKNYCPEDTKHPKLGERCFYTRENGLIIDTLRKYIEENVEEDIQHYCLSQLLIKSSK